MKNQHDEQSIIALYDEIRKNRATCWPPKFAVKAVEDLPVYMSIHHAVESYIAQSWAGLFEKAQELGLKNEKDNADVLFPSELEFPLIYTGVRKVIFNKTAAKESKTFRSVIALLDICGLFEESERFAMSEWLNQEDHSACLVAHRHYIDIRAHIFQDKHNQSKRVRFYNNGLLLGCTAKVEIIDARDKPRKERNDRYTDPIADNGVWLVYGRYK